MAHFTSGGFQLADTDQGAGDPIVLVHGFGSSGAINWGNTGWVAALVASGRRVITLDNRGHGLSASPART